MNLSELIHRPSEDGQSVVSSNYESSFQRSPTEPMHLDTLYNKVGSDLMDTRFTTTDHHNHQHLIHDAYSSSKLMTTSSSNSSSGSPHWQFAPPESSRSPYASTLSDQSINEPIRPASDLRGGSSTTSNSTTGGGANSNTNGGGNSGAMSTTARGPSSNSPVSPIPLDNTSSVDHHHYRKRRLSLNDASSYNHYSPDDKSTDQQLPSSKSTSTGIAGLYGRKDMTLTINGTNVTKDNIEEGYVQFIWHNDPSYIGDSIENLMYVKRKFSSVPKTGDLAYTTWDVYALVKKLHNNEIKNWSQLVGRLGLADVPGRPQFAQRVKRWMRKYRIDCYFDYLLGNPYNFNAGPNDEYTGCLVMGNYQKRRGNRTHTMVTNNNTATSHSTDDVDSRKSMDEFSSTTTRKRQKHHDDDENKDESADNDEEDDDDRNTRRTPIAHAGSRKRARNQPLLTSAMDDQEDDEKEHLTSSTTAIVTEEEREAGNTEDSTQMAEQPPSVYPMEYLREDEEDELASSTSSSPATSPAASSPEPSHESLSLSAKSTKPRQQHSSTSPTITTTTTIPPAAPSLSPSSSFKHTDTTAVAPITDHSLLSSPSPSQPLASSSSVAAVVPTTNASPPSQSPSHHHHPHLPSSCQNCTRLQDTVHHLQDDIVLLKQQLSTMQARLDEESEAKTAMVHRIDQLCTHYDKWRTQLAEQLLQSPFAE
ncbi:hypothetical protein K492DRAFT_235343 [Lichtheimia hyalospora FSU 10163]|nr:hypothetical protein K492DRAFT_235343 [Lichtheimia hyalospora FSU 10163]